MNHPETPPSNLIASRAEEPARDGEDFAFDFLWLKEVAARHWWAIILIFLITFLCGMILFLREPPMYESLVKIRIEPRRAVFDTERYLSVERINDHFYRGQVTIIKSRKLARQVLEQVGVEQFRFAMNQPTWVETLIQSVFSSSRDKNAGDVSSVTSPVTLNDINKYLNRLSVNSDRMAPQIINIKFETPQPEFTAQLLNTHAQAYMDYSRKSNALYTDDFIEGMEGQLEQLKTQIAELDQEILTYKQKHEFFQIQGMNSYDPIQDIDDRISRIREQLSQAMEEVNKTQAAYESLFEVGQVGQYAGLRREVITSSRLEKLRAEQTNLHQKWADIKDRYLSRHPLYISTKSQMDVVESAIQEEIESQVQRIKTAFEEAMARKAALVEQEQNYIKEKYARDEQWRHLKNLEQAREQLLERKSTILKDLQNAKGSLETQKQTRSRIFEILDDAETARAPNNRNWPRIFLLSIAAAISAALTGGLLLEFQDRTVRTPHQLEQLTNITVMGSIPRFDKDEFSLMEGRLRDYELTPAGEAFIALRTRFLFSDLIQTTQSILVTSTLAKEGKSTIAVNLASSMAMVGRRVVLIDCDLRKPQLHHFFGESESPGLMDIVKGVEILEQTLIETDIPGLFLLPAGSPQAHPSEILSATAFDELIRLLKEEFDFLILDSPPILMTPEPAILSPKLDITLMVARCGQTIGDELVSAIDHVHRSGGEVFSLILNDVPQAEKRAYYQQGYGMASDYASNNLS